jgi:hypothetical protein
VSSGKPRAHNPWISADLSDAIRADTDQAFGGPIRADCIRSARSPKHKVREDEPISTPNVIKSCHPTQEWPLGWYDLCLFKNDLELSWTGKIDDSFQGALMNCWLMLRLKTSHSKITVLLRSDLSFSRCFEIPRFHTFPISYTCKEWISSPQTDYSIVSIERILAMVDLVLYFGAEANERLTKENSMAFSTSFHLNIFSDKYIYQHFRWLPRTCIYGHSDPVIDFQLYHLIVICTKYPGTSCRSALNFLIPAYHHPHPTPHLSLKRNIAWRYHKL